MRGADREGGHQPDVEPRPAEGLQHDVGEPAEDDFLLLDDVDGRGLLLLEDLTTSTQVGNPFEGARVAQVEGIVAELARRLDARLARSAKRAARKAAKR